MAANLCLTEQNRSRGYIREAVRQDVLYSYCRIREVSISVSKKDRIATRLDDGMVQQLQQLGLITAQQKAAYDKAALQALYHIEEFDSYSSEELYSFVNSLRKTLLGTAVLERYNRLQAQNATGFSSDGIDQSAIKGRLLQSSDTVLFALTQAKFLPLLRADLEKAQESGKTCHLICGQPGDQLLSKSLLTELLGDHSFWEYDGIISESLQNPCLLFYGEEGLTACRSLTADAIVHAIPEGYHAQAVTGLWSGEGCTVYIPKGLDITQFVPLTQKTRLNFSILYRLWQDQGDGIYSLPLTELYNRYPKYFINVYSGMPCDLPISIDARELSSFDRQLDQGLEQYLSGFETAQYRTAYFDENLNPQPICYDASQKQPGILVQAVKVTQSAGAKVLSCEKGTTPRQMFKNLQLPGVGLVSNYLFFMTPKLGILYNDLRADRPLEQADAASGHLDYMRMGQIETFPLFSKACMAMKEDGTFMFFNFRLGGGNVTISDIPYSWTCADVDNPQAELQVYTPFFSASDGDADRNTYRKLVGADRVNVILLRDKVTCIRRGDVLLPSVGVVLSMTAAAAAPLLEKCTPLKDGYYDISKLTLSVQLDPPEGICPEDWAKVCWAYGGGLTLIRDGIGLCDGDHMKKWFEDEGWASPLSRQTQESNLHTLAKHPRTAIGCTRDGALVVLVFSGRTWRSTGADYREMIAIARQLFPDIHFLMNCDGGGSAMLGMVQEGDFLELSYPSTSSGSCAGQVRPINTIFYIPLKGEEA